MSDLGARLIERIQAADTDGVVGLLAPLGEADRARLANLARGAFEDLCRREYAALYGGGGPDLGEVDLSLLGECQRVAALAWLGTGEIRDFPVEPDIGQDYEGWVRWQSFEVPCCATEQGHQILVDRRPPWLRQLAERYLDWHCWHAAWHLVADGLVPRLETAGYLHGMAASAGRAAPLVDMVRRDPALLEVDLPRLLALPDGVRRLAAGDERDVWATVRRKQRVWSPVLVASFPPGHPIRAQLLDGTLGLLLGDVDPAEAATYHRFLDALKPTVEEIAARRRQYVALARHRVPALVSLAVKSLTRLDRKKPLPAEEIVGGLAPALYASAKTTAKGVVGLIDAAMRRDPSVAGRAVRALAPALTHPQVEVQHAAVEAVLPRLSRDWDIAVFLASLVPDMSASAAERLRGLLPQSTDAPSGDYSDGMPDLDDLLRAAAWLPREVASRTGVDAALTAAHHRREPPAVVLEPWTATSPTCRHRAMVPVADLDELVEVLLRCVDGHGSVADVERGLDGLAALGARRPDDLGRRLGPLIKRVNHWFSLGRGGWGTMVPLDFCMLVATWAQPQRGAAPETPLSSPFGWLAGRIREVALDLANGRASRLLALPTDSRGWIDPTTLVARVAAVGDGWITRPVDAATAIMRLAPWGRAAARAEAAGLPGPLGRAIRAACGSEDDLTGLPTPVANAVGWLGGQPHEGPPYLFGGEGEPVLPLPGGWKQYQDAWVYARARDYGDGWAHALWPADHRWIWQDNTLSQALLRLLLDPDEPLFPAALAAVLRQPADTEPEQRVLAADVLTQAIADGRVASPGLTNGLVSVLSADHAVAGRVARMLVQAARASPLHRVVVRRALIASVSAWRTQQSAPRCAFLTLLDELCAADRTGVPGGGRRAELSELTAGKSKSASLARGLLARPVAAEEWSPEASALTLSGRIERAERWCAQAATVTPTEP